MLLYILARQFVTIKMKINSRFSFCRKEDERLHMCTNPGKMGHFKIGHMQDFISTKVHFFSGLFREHHYMPLYSLTIVQLIYIPEGVSVKYTVLQK